MKKNYFTEHQDMMSDTPETDAAEMPIDRVDTAASRPCCIVNADFARKMERERNLLMREIQLLLDSTKVERGQQMSNQTAPSEMAIQYADYILNHYSRHSIADKICLARDLERHGWSKSHQSECVLTSPDGIKFRLTPEFVAMESGGVYPRIKIRKIGKMEL
jgi:hypothetical protein